VLGGRCDPIWQVMLGSSVMGFPLRAVLGFNLFNLFKQKLKAATATTAAVVFAAFLLLFCSCVVVVFVVVRVL